MAADSATTTTAGRNALDVSRPRKYPLSSIRGVVHTKKCLNRFHNDFRNRRWQLRTWRTRVLDFHNYRVGNDELLFLFPPTPVGVAVLFFGFISVFLQIRCRETIVFGFSETAEDRYDYDVTMTTNEKATTVTSSKVTTDLVACAPRRNGVLVADDRSIMTVTIR